MRTNIEFEDLGDHPGQASQGEDDSRPEDGNTAPTWPNRLGGPSPAICFILLMCVLFTGCAGLEPRAVPMLFNSEAAPVGFSNSIRIIGDSTPIISESTDTIPRLRLAASPEPISILVLSGGGAGGAFGAGALVGWTHCGTRPEFQIVTGVSVGALIAPFAFLGSKWDGPMTDAFSGARTTHLLQRRWTQALFGASLYRGEPLVKLVDGYVTQELVRALAREAAKGRLLLVATTDLDTEQRVIWNLTAIATHGGERARKLIRDVLIAAVSIPGAFPPVMISVEAAGRLFDEMHVDGATSASLLLGPEIAEYLSDSQALRDARLYIIVNGQLGAPAQRTPKRTLKIIRRGLAAEFRSSSRTDLTLASLFAQSTGMKVAATGIPDDYSFQGLLDMRESTMRALFDLGEHCAERDQLWAAPMEVQERAQHGHIENAGAATRCPAPARHPQAFETANLVDERPTIEAVSFSLGR